MKHFQFFIVSLIVLGINNTAFSGELDRGIALRQKLTQASGKTIGAYRALIIGINAYEDSDIPELRTAVNDATELASILKKEYGFSEVTLKWTP